MSGPILKGRRRRRHSRVRIELFQALAAPISILRNRQAAVGSEAPPPPQRPLFRRFAAREESAGRRNARLRPEPGEETIRRAPALAPAGPSFETRPRGASDEVLGRPSISRPLRFGSRRGGNPAK